MSSNTGSPSDIAYIRALQKARFYQKLTEQNGPEDFSFKNPTEFKDSIETFLEVLPEFDSDSIKQTIKSIQDEESYFTNLIVFFFIFLGIIFVFILRILVVRKSGLCFKKKPEVNGIP